MHLKKPIKCIFFDLSGTLCQPATSHWMFPKKAEGLINMESINYIPIKRFNSAYNNCVRFLDENRLAKTMEEEYETFIKFYSILSDYLPEFELSKEKIKHIAHDKVYNDDNVIFFDDVSDTLSALCKEYKLGIISDSWPSSEKKLKSANLYDYLSCLTLSCHFGICGPNKEMFEHALSEIGGFAAEEAVLVDDSRQNLLNAKNHGLQSVLSNTKNNKKDSDFLTIFNISEILEHV